MFGQLRATVAAYSLLFLIMVGLVACGGGGDPTGPGGGEAEKTNVVSSLISVDPGSSIVGILSNKSGAAVFYQEVGASDFLINRVVIITSTGETTSFVRTPAKALPATGDRYFTVETGINEVMDGVNRGVQSDLEASPLTRTVSGELVRALDEEILNPESFTDRVTRFVTDAALNCNDTIVDCVNSFRSAIGNEEDQIDNPDSNPSGPPLITSGDVDIVDAEGTRTPTNALANFTVTPVAPTAPADLTASLVQGTPTNFNGTGLTHAWSYEKLPSDGFTPIVLGSGTSANLSATEPGSYRIILNVRYISGGGNVATTSRTIEVLPATVDGPSFTATTQSTTLPKLYVLTATDPSETATNFAWSSSDGQTAQGESTSLTFNTEGDFLITLVVTYPGDVAMTVTKTITVVDNGGGIGEVHEWIQATFDHHAGTYTSTHVEVYPAGTTYDGITATESYEVVIDPVNLRVILNPSGGGPYYFAPDLLDYQEFNHLGWDPDPNHVFRIMFYQDGNNLTGKTLILGRNETSLYFRKSETNPLRSFAIEFSE